jgi:radical SAM/Cys-rich protein
MYLGVRSLSTVDAPTSVNVGDTRLKRSTKRAGKSLFGGSLVADTLKEMEEDEDFKATASNLKKLGQAKMTLEERKKRRRALNDMNVPAFHEFLESHGLTLDRKATKILQLNIGLYCNQACNHCHVESSPKRTEAMTIETADRCLELLDSTPGITTLDLTGGAPELNPAFRHLVVEGSKRGLEVIDRCNLTVLMEPDQEDLADFLAEHKVRVVASLPCYTPANVNTQRGKGVFDRSIEGLKLLNSLGYGNDLVLDLIYNPSGAFLPPAQEALQTKYKQQLMDDFGIEFNNLYTITNQPIKRFADFLYRRGTPTIFMNS